MHVLPDQLICKIEKKIQGMSFYLPKKLTMRFKIRSFMEHFLLKKSIGAS